MNSSKLHDDIDVRADLRRACLAAGGQNFFARKHRLSASYINDVLKHHKPIGPKICGALKYIRVWRYVKRGKA